MVYWLSIPHTSLKLEQLPTHELAKGKDVGAIGGRGEVNKLTSQ